MTDRPPGHPPSQTSPSRPATTARGEAARRAREAREAEALRENLRKRRAQIAARGTPRPPEE